MPANSPAAPIRVVLAGVGTRGRHWGRVLQAHRATEIAACVDPAAEARAWARAELGVPPERCFGALEPALDAAGADVLLLATPPVDRERECAAGFRRGLRVLAEKPLTVDLAEAVRIVRAAPDAHSLRVAMNFRFIPVHLAYRELLRSGVVGAPGFARFVYWRNRDGRRPGINKYPLTMAQPMLLEQSIHHFDTFRFVYDSEIVAVAARTANPPWSMYRDDATVLATFDLANGVLLEYVGTWAARTPLHEHHWRTDCAGGAIYQREQWGALSVLRPAEPGPPGTEPDEETIPLPAWEALYDDAHALWRAYAAELHGEPAPPLGPDAVPAAAASTGQPGPAGEPEAGRAGAEPSDEGGATRRRDPGASVLPAAWPAVPTGRDHLVSLAVAFACLDSSREGRRVAMRDFARRHDIADLLTGGAG